MAYAEKTLCAIPARAGSKRLPGKNIMPVAGKPMIAYSIEAALRSELFEDVYVCTNSAEIAEIAVSYGAQVPYLMPEDLCGDLVGSNVPCQHLAEYLINKGQPIETLVCLQPTSPLRSAEDIRQGMSVYQEDDVDFVVSVTPVDPHYFHWALHTNEKGYWEMYFGEKYIMERPLLPPVFRPNGSIKIGKFEAVREIDHFFGERLGMVETPEERSVHVATNFELDLCEFLLRRN